MKSFGKFICCICVQIISAHFLDYDAGDYQPEPSIVKRNGLIPNLTNFDHIEPFLKFDSKLKSHVEVTKNGKVILQCRVSASPPAIIYWQFYRSQTPLDEKNRITRGRLETWNDNGFPKISNSVESHVGHEEENDIFDVESNIHRGGYRERREVMDSEDYDDNSPLSENDNGEYSPRKLGLSVTKSRLEIDCLDYDDAGTYICVAENAAKIIKQSSTLKVKDNGKPKCEPITGVKIRPNFYISNLKNVPKVDIIRANGKRERPKITPARIYMWTENRIDNQGTNVRIFCRSSGVPKPTIAWLSPLGTTLHNNNKYKLLKNGDLYIKNISWEDDMGLYICLVNNKYGSDHKEAFLYPLNKNGDDEESELV